MTARKVKKTSKTKPMKMKKVAESLPGEDPVFHVEVVEPDQVEQQAAKAKPASHVFEGTDAFSEKQPTTPKLEKGFIKFGRNEKGMVTTMTENIENEMPEMSLEEFNQSQSSQLAREGTDGSKTVKERLRDLISLGAATAQTALEKMVADHQITSYRVINVGQTQSADFVAGRVQVVLDAAKRVIDVTVG